MHARKAMSSVAPHVALVPSCFPPKLKRSGFLRVFIWSLETTEKLSTGVSEENQLGPTSVITNTLAFPQVDGGGAPPETLYSIRLCYCFKRFLSMEIFTFLHKPPDQTLDLLIIWRLEKQK